MPQEAPTASAPPMMAETTTEMILPTEHPRVH